MTLVPSFPILAHKLLLTLAWTIPSPRREGGKVQSILASASNCFSGKMWVVCDALSLLGGPVSYSQG